jgi:adenylosuccinate lyase
MKVWADQQLTFFHELNKSVEIKKYLSEIELKEIFDNKKMLNNVNFIFARTIEAD